MPMVLVIDDDARIDAVLRRARPSAPPSPVLTAGPIRVDVDRRSVTRDGEAIDLTTTEFDILRALVAQAGRVIPRERLMELARGESYASFDRSVDVHISHLRKKLGDSARRPALIKTVRGVVVVTSALSWLVTSRLVFRPLIDQVYAAYLAEVAFVGERIDQGGNIDHLERSLDLQITPFAAEAPGYWRTDVVRGRRLHKPPGPRNLVVVETRHGPYQVRAAADAFNALAERIESMLHSEKQLMAGISHELRTPLTRLRLEIELLRDQGVDPRRLDRMESDLEQLDELVGEALELSRLQLGARSPERSEVDLKSLATEVVSTIELGKRTVELDLLPAEVLGDPRLIERAVINLLVNTTKYTPNDAKITIRIREHELVVADSGPGVPEEDLPHLFEPFYRTDSGSQRASGQGLGLMIVQQVMRLHGGRARAENGHPGRMITLHFGRLTSVRAATTPAPPASPHRDRARASRS